MIPKVLHFCFGMSEDFGGKPWSLVHYVCLRSAIERIRPSNAFLYFEFEPQGPWWDLARALVTPVAIQAPRSIFGNPLSHPAHRADVVRLEKLLDLGGIYLDLDVLVHKDVDDLLEHTVVLGEEAPGARRQLCNAVILGVAGAPFLKRWHDAYRSFRSTGRDANWNDHSVGTPSRLAHEFPDECTVLPPSSFFPASWQPTGISGIFASCEPLLSGGASYATHLWETFAWNGYLRDLTPGRVRRVESNFHHWCRPYLRELPDDFGAPARLSPSGVRSAIVTTCKGRLSFLRKTLPLMVATGCAVTVVDFDCPEGTEDFVRRDFPQVSVVKLNERPVFNLAAARNAGAAAAGRDGIAFIDCDVELSEHFTEFLRATEVGENEFLTGDLSDPQLIGQCMVPRRLFDRVGGYDEVMVGWGYEDDDLYARLEKAGAKRGHFSAGIMSALPHGDDLRLKLTTRESNKWAAHRINSVYSHIKGDIEGASRPLTLAERQELRRLVEGAISRLRTEGGSLTFSLSLKQLSMTAGTDKISEGAYRLDSALEYTLSLGN